jgi:hypothetical protein
MGGRDQYISVHTFKVEVRRRTRRPRLWVEREYSEAQRRYLNVFRVSLGVDGTPLADQEIEVWCVEREQPGYDPWNKVPLAERMAAGGTLYRLRTGIDGTARLNLSHLDDLSGRPLPYEPIHHSYQLVARFNPDRSSPDFQPACLPQLEFYADGSLDPPSAAPP